MNYSTRRIEILRRLGVEQIPALCDEHKTHKPVSCDYDDEMSSPLRGNLPVRTMPVPGKRCPCCMSRGQTVWVIPGKRCPQCGAEVN